MLDTYDKPNREEIMAIEKRIFDHVKPDVEEQTGEWSGSKLQNSIADLEVATSIFKSLKSYEDGKKRVGTFFNFKRFPSSKNQ